MPHALPTDPPSDEELACRAQQGCAASFDELMRRFQTPVLHFLRRRGSPLDAEDLLQDTFLRAYENLHRYRGRWPFVTWLFTIARRVSINGHRRWRPLLETSQADPAGTASNPLDMLAEMDGRRYLWSVIDRILSEEERTALWLHYVEEMPAREIGRVLGRSRTAVKTMLFRARKRLLPHLRDLDPRAADADGSATLEQNGEDFAASLEARHV